MQEGCLWKQDSDQFDGGIPARADVVIIGGDLPSLLLGSRLAQTGRSIVVLTDEVGNGAFGMGHGIISPHYGLDLHGVEEAHGGNIAKSFLDLRQYVVDELDAEHKLEHIQGHALSHDVHTTLKMRNEHETLNRHGASRSWHSSHGGDVHASVRERSSYSGDLGCNPIELLHSIVDRIDKLGGVVKSKVQKLKCKDEGDCVRVQTDHGDCEAGSVCDLSCVSPLRETLYATGGDAVRAEENQSWYHDSYPMFDYVRCMRDGRWLVGSRRTWTVGDDELACVKRLGGLGSKIISDKFSSASHIWTRPFVAYDRHTLPNIQLSGRIIKTSGLGQDDSVMDLIAVDELARMYTRQQSMFDKVFETLPRAEFSSGHLSRMAFQAMLDARLSADSIARGRN